MFRIVIFFLMVIPVSGEHLNRTQPPCIQKLLEDGVQDPNSKYYCMREKSLLPPDIDFSQLKLYVALPIYNLDFSKLESPSKFSYSGKLDDYLVHKGLWCVPVYYGDKIIYELEVFEDSGECRTYRTSYSNPSVEKSPLDQIDIRFFRSQEDLPILIYYDFGMFYVYYPKEKRKRILKPNYRYSKQELSKHKGPPEGETVKDIEEFDPSQFVGKVRKNYLEFKKNEHSGSHESVFPLKDGRGR